MEYIVGMSDEIESQMVREGLARERTRELDNGKVALIVQKKNMSFI